MEHHIRGKDNFLLVEFESVIDMDYGLYNYIREKFWDNDIFDKQTLSLETDVEVIQMLINRPHMNPIECLTNENVTTLYQELMEDKNNRKEVLKYSRPYDTLGLMVTFLDEASSVDLEILCEYDYEADLIKYLAPSLKTVISPREMVNLNDYSVIYLKYFAYALLYPQPLEGKHLYIPMAGFNMHEGLNIVNLRLAKIFADSNLLHFYNLYKSISYIPPLKEAVTDESESTD